MQELQEKIIFFCSWILCEFEKIDEEEYSALSLTLWWLI